MILLIPLYLILYCPVWKTFVTIMVKTTQLCSFNNPPSSSVQIRDGDLVCVRELVGKCLAEYATSKCSRPNSRRLRWIISGRTARHLKHSYYKITHLPTIPESAY